MTPNTGRIIDHWLGGAHHDAADVLAGAELTGRLPAYPEIFRAHRAFLGRAVRAIANHGATRFLVFGAGIPACGNVHEAAPTARVLYTDVDPVNVEAGRRILADVPRADYRACDLTALDDFDWDGASAFLGGLDRLGVVCVGIAGFLDDALLRAALGQLDARLPSGTLLALDFDGPGFAQHPEVTAFLERVGDPLHVRRPADVRGLLGPWACTEAGIRDVADWDEGAAADAAADGAYFYGCVTVKP